MKTKKHRAIIEAMQQREFTHQLVAAAMRSKKSGSPFTITMDGVEHKFGSAGS